MKHIIFIFIVIFSSIQLRSQCFQIQSVLVDACAGSQEGQNEMVTFQVGSVALNTANLSVNWPNNSWLGLTKNASTAANVATVNATIVGCGFLKEPTANVLPANSKVLLVTSTAWLPLAQSFTNLNDTLYIIFQTAGNTNGHFANYGSGLRSLSMSFSTPSGCNDAVTYNRALLLNQSQAAGAQDGGTVEFSASGVANYVNNGCQAPYIPLTVNAGPDKTICIGGTQNFTATVSGAYTSVNWSLGTGASGTFAPTNSLTTSYTAGGADNGTIKLYCTIFKTCGTQTTTAKDSVLLTITPLPIVNVNPSMVTVCSGGSAIVQASANAPVGYTWSTGAMTNSVSLNAAGVYTVNVSNTCGNASQTVTVSVGISPSVTASASQTLLCSNQTVTLSITGTAGTYLWSNGATSSTTSASNSGIYTVTLTNGCGQATSSVSITALQNPTVSISSSSAILCSGATVTLTVNSNSSNYQWNTGENTNVILVNTAGVKTVTVSNACGTASASLNITSVNFPPLVLTSTSNSICPNETATLTVTGGSVPYIWSNSVSTNSSVVTNGGTVTVSNTNVCGVNSASIIIDVNPISSNISANPSTGSYPLIVDFTNYSSNATSYLWDFGNGNTATTQNVLPETYNNPGVYTVYLTVSNGICSDIDSVTIIVTELEPTLYVPNAFTPNADNTNDVFWIGATNIKEFYIIIFDRWGLKLFESSDLLVSWTGKVNGKEVADGCYFYLISRPSKSQFLPLIIKQSFKNDF